MIDNPTNKINEFDFDTRKCKPTCGLMYNHKNGLEENKKVMLLGLQNFCMNCRLCQIGCDLVQDKDGQQYDPHVLSNMMFNADFMVVGQNPGMNEIKFGTPFIGDSGKNFDEELNKNGIDRTKFYITNIVKCFSRKPDGTNNRTPNALEKRTCSSTFLITEIKIIKPKLIITLGGPSFNFFFPNESYSDRLGKITNSEHGKIYAVYHPSPLNINDPARRKIFNRQIELLAKLIKKIS
jgi:DNA polymerase